MHACFERCISVDESFNQIVANKYSYILTSSSYTYVIYLSFRIIYFKIKSCPLFSYFQYLDFNILKEQTNSSLTISIPAALSNSPQYCGAEKIVTHRLCAQNSCHLQPLGVLGKPNRDRAFLKTFAITSGPKYMILHDHYLPIRQHPYLGLTIKGRIRVLNQAHGKASECY